MLLFLLHNSFLLGKFFQNGLVVNFEILELDLQFVDLELESLDGVLILLRAVAF